MKTTKEVFEASLIPLGQKRSTNSRIGKTAEKAIYALAHPLTRAIEAECTDKAILKELATLHKAREDDAMTDRELFWSIMRVAARAGCEHKCVCYHPSKEDMHGNPHFEFGAFVSLEAAREHHRFNPGKVRANAMADALAKIVSGYPSYTRATR